MKTLIVSLLALTLLGTTAATADVGAGIHIGGLGIGANVGVHGHHHGHRHCTSWGRHHSCRHWGW
jgi:hypothetical protein